MKGKILRVKHGYNPNSSSMGSIVFALPAAIFGLATAFGAVSGVIFAAFLKKSPKKDDTKQQSEVTEQ
ncbi:MAG: hypothetical protein KAS75_09000 [Planctomycetes bacterium]|nr:hypothetical protein [Planctomycetota bacterium]